MITIILPVHNSEKYLKNCIESMIHQTIQDLEFLCVDGGSTDSSISILEEYADKDNRIRIIYDSNTSYGHKINIGIEQAKGKYISILESDDLIEQNTFEELLSIAEEMNVDYVSADFYSFFELGGCRYRQKMNKINTNEYYDRVIEGGENIALISVSGIAIWSGLYKKSFLVDNHIYLNETPGAAYQDTGFSFLIMALAQRSYHVQEAFYNYRIDNVSSSVKNQKAYSIIAGEYDYIRNELIKRKFDDKNIWEKYYIRKYRGFLWNLGRLTGEYQDLFYDIFYREYTEDSLCQYLNFDIFPEDLQLSMSRFGDREEFICSIKDQPKIMFVQFQEFINILYHRNPIFIFGYGYSAEMLLSLLPDKVKSNIVYFCDNDNKKWGTSYQGFTIMNPAEAFLIDNAYFVIANRRHIAAIEQQLLQNRIKKENMAIFNEDIIVEMIRLPNSI